MLKCLADVFDCENVWFIQLILKWKWSHLSCNFEYWPRIDTRLFFFYIHILKKSWPFLLIEKTSLPRNLLSWLNMKYILPLSQLVEYWEGRKTVIGTSDDYEVALCLFWSSFSAYLQVNATATPEISRLAWNTCRIIVTFFRWDFWLQISIWVTSK